MDLIQQEIARVFERHNIDHDQVILHYVQLIITRDAFDEGDMIDILTGTCMVSTDIVKTVIADLRVVHKFVQTFHCPPDAMLHPCCIPPVVPTDTPVSMPEEEDKDMRAIKRRVVSAYQYQSEYSTGSAPVLSKIAYLQEKKGQKKRYRDNRVVSEKGDKYV